ncbi:unnamed protein product [Triticum turgidum subsp. durum]|uniref:non-specific serine/threonine protein kinase n=1 Tax=Triticum turgidum subsp. durum TaxID=4567 RepID=A0A9R1B6L9_TRITD|nr:unnamed protein product [Triticum turgidum subsp. durum]
MANTFEHTNVTTREFTFQYLQQITNNFSQEHIIGQGGFGVVYKGVLHNGEEIALKKLYWKPDIGDAEFRNEFTNLMRVQHPNITRLVGYCYNLGEQHIEYNGKNICADVEERVLCFEYLPGSLDKHITDISVGLDWCTRFRIIKGVCEGLNYLHNGAKDPIYHLDLKPENILLDKDMIPKIGDFGLSKLFISTQTKDANKFTGTLGYMPPEYIDRSEITSKFDVFSLGAIILRIMTGKEGYSRPEMSTQHFSEHVNENWERRLQATMSSFKSEEVRTCIKIALRCVEVDSEKRPTIAEIVDELNNVDTTKSPPTGQVTSSRSKHALSKSSHSEHRGRIAFSTTYRPPVPLDIFSCPLSPSSTEKELLLTDGISYNYNGRSIPPAALKTLLKNPKVANEIGATNADVDAGHVSGLIFVSERDDGLETLYIALRFSKVKVFALADIFGAADFCGARLEDSGCIGGGCSVRSQTIDHCLIYISTKEPVQKSRNPWTAVYRTYLTTGKTERLTPPGEFDLSPSVSPSGKKVAVARFRLERWDDGEIENLKTDICIMNVDRKKCAGLGRMIVLRQAGWPSWGSNNIIFFHRCVMKDPSIKNDRTSWGVFQYNISTKKTIRVTQKELDAVTPAAISETKVAVATIREKFVSGQSARTEEQYRHIEIFDTDMLELPPVRITHKMRPKSDHYNPFVLDGGERIGYHRCLSEHLRHGDRVHRNLYKLESPVEDIGLYRVSGMSPTISMDGSKLAFVDNEFKAVWVADSQGLRIVFKSEGGSGSVFSPVWNQNPAKDILYVCVGPSFHSTEPLEIYAIQIGNHSDMAHQQIERLTHGGFNNAFPSSSPDGNNVVYRSTRDGHKNLYIMNGGIGIDQKTMRLTAGPWTDTHCQWSPKGDWIAFASTRDTLSLAAYTDFGLDLGFFSVYLVKASDPMVVIRVIGSGDIYSGHVNHPVFSPDGRIIAVTADLAAVSVDPISLPWYLHAVRPYGDIFLVDIDPDEEKNRDVKVFRRMTHSRYECRTPAWTSLFTTPAHAQWNMLLKFEDTRYKPVCPYIYPDGGESWHMTGHLSMATLWHR